ncbi:MAG: hypothetical protein HUU09_14825 [Candidatus Jettenia caeni]|nr:hypothetical protein [Candidatus Jettenia caeni]UJS18487.1 MAG: hypothetical protein L3J17_05370 [Candidatus Jettenia sp.]
MSEQEKLFFLKNQKLFSNNYLEYRFQSSSLWNADNEKVHTAFEDIKYAYKSIQSLKLGPGEEANLEDKFIRPVLAALEIMNGMSSQPPREVQEREDLTTHYLKIKIPIKKPARERIIPNTSTLIPSPFWKQNTGEEA